MRRQIKNTAVLHEGGEFEGARDVEADAQHGGGHGDPAQHGGEDLLVRRIARRGLADNA
jgi:hypothetical protein